MSKFKTVQALIFRAILYLKRKSLALSKAPVTKIRKKLNESERKRIKVEQSVSAGSVWDKNL